MRRVKKLLGIIILATAVLAVPINAAEITVQPYLQKPTTTGMTVVWWTDSSERASRVLYGLKELKRAVQATNKKTPSMGMWAHEAKVTGLEPDITYKYQVISGSSRSAVLSFTTAPKPDAGFKFAVLGDGRTDNPVVLRRHRQTALKAMETGAAFLIEAGDIVKNGSKKHWKRFLREVLTNSLLPASSSVGARLPFFPVVGNHEIYDPKLRYDTENSLTMSRYKSVFANFANNTSNIAWSERYYAFEYGCAAFIVLDANNDSNDEFDNNRYLRDGSTPDWSPGSEQYEWMVKLLKRFKKTKAFTFVLFHPSPYSRGVHGNPENSQSGYQLRALEPVFRKLGVDAVITSHDHTAERCLTGPAGFEEKMDVADPANLNWFVIGNSGEASRREAKKWRTWMSVTGDAEKPFYSRFFYPWAGRNEFTSFLLVDLNKSESKKWSATFEFVRSDGRRFDKTVIFRREP